jgi:hypothetical protein
VPHFFKYLKELVWPPAPAEPEKIVVKLRTPIKEASSWSTVHRITKVVEQKAFDNEVLAQPVIRWAEISKAHRSQAKIAVPDPHYPPKEVEARILTPVEKYSYYQTLARLNSPNEYRDSLGRLHREDGPAVVSPDGVCEYWIEGIKQDRPVKLHVGKGGLWAWRDNSGATHRIGGPAVLYDNCKVWKRNGITHRENGPAVEWDGGGEEWRQCGELHRLDGPAFIVGNSAPMYYISGKRFEEQEFKRLTEERCLGT